MPLKKIPLHGIIITVINMRISICENNSRDAVRLHRLLERYQSERQVKMDIAVYGKSEELLGGYIPGDTHIVFIDVAFGGAENELRGVELAKRLRGIDPNCVIIFTAEDPEHAAVSYDAGAVHYLVKPVTYEFFSEAMNRCEKQSEQFVKYIEVTANREHVRVMLRDIVYA